MGAFRNQVDFTPNDLARASSAQNNMAADSAQRGRVWVLIRRLNSSCRRSMAFEARFDRYGLASEIHRHVVEHALDVFGVGPVGERRQAVLDQI